jgi:hypothetical protein
MATQTLSQEVFNSRKELAIKIQPVRKTVSLGQIEIVNPGVVKVEGNPIPMDKKAFRQLARILGVPIQFQGRVDKYYGETTTSQIVNKMKSGLITQGVSNITMIANPREKNIVGFIKKENQYISNNTFFGIAEDIIDDLGLYVRDFSTNNDDGGITINCFNPNAEFQIGDFKDEYFQGGITLSNSIENGIIISPYMNRLICLNGMIGDSFGEAFKVRGVSPGHMEELRQHLNSLEKRNFKPFSFEERVKKSMETKCSFAELEYAADLIISNSAAQKEEIIQWNPIHQTESKFMEYGLFPGLMTTEKKKNAKTGTTIWEMVNGLTHFATHESQFKVYEDSRRVIQKSAGEILAGTYDMENIVVGPYN